MTLKDIEFVDDPPGWSDLWKSFNPSEEPSWVEWRGYAFFLLRGGETDERFEKWILLKPAMWGEHAVWLHIKAQFVWAGDEHLKKLRNRDRPQPIKD